MTAIEFENISKQYRLGLVSTGTLSHDLNRFWQTKDGVSPASRGRVVAVQNRRLMRRFSRSEGRAQLTSGPPIAPEPNAMLKLV